MHTAFDLGVTVFDAADTYGNGLSEELIARAFPTQRDEIVIATKVGYDFVHHGQARGRGQREIPQDFSPEAVLRATDAALQRLKTDRIDVLQLHNIRMEQVYDDALWTTLEKLKTEGKIRYYGIALGPAIGWLYEGANCIRERNITSVQHIYNVLEQHPGHAIHAPRAHAHPCSRGCRARARIQEAAQMVLDWPIFPLRKTTARKIARTFSTQLRHYWGSEPCR